MGKISGSRIRIRDEQLGSYFRELRNHFLGLKYINSLMRIGDPGWKNIGSGMENFGSGIREKHPGSATLIFSIEIIPTTISPPRSPGQVTQPYPGRK
jgi:hypothetical protein